MAWRGEAGLGKAGQGLARRGMARQGINFKEGKMTLSHRLNSEVSDDDI